MSDERVFLTVDQALALLPGDSDVHTFLNPGPSILLGADWRRETIEAAVRNAVARELAGEAARGMGHGLVLDKGGGEFVFVATDPAALERLDQEVAAGADPRRLP